MPTVDPLDADILSAIQSYLLGLDPPNTRFDGYQVVRPTVHVVHHGRNDGFNFQSSILKLEDSVAGSAAKAFVIEVTESIGDLVTISNYDPSNPNRKVLLVTEDGRFALMGSNSSPGYRMIIHQASTSVPGFGVIAAGTTGQDLFRALDSGDIKRVYIDISGQLHWVDSQNNTKTFPNGNPEARDHTMAAWSYDPVMAVGSNQLTEEQIYLVKVYVSKPATVSSIMLYITNPTAGTPTNSYGGIYSTGGVRLAQTADVGGSGTTTGLKTAPLTAPVALTTGYYHVAILPGNGPGNGPALASAGAPTGIGNANLATASLRFANGPSGQTSLPSTITMSGLTQTGFQLWCALV